MTIPDRNEQEEYVLGEDVTAQAAAKASKGTAVLSVRLPIEDLATLESLSRVTGRTTSQLVREALTSYLQTRLQPNFVFTMSRRTETFSSGAFPQLGRPAGIVTLDDYGQAAISQPA